MIFADADVATTHMRRRIQAFDPDWILVSDDKGRSLLPLATAAGRRVAMIVQTGVHLPFGPLSTGVDPEQEQRMRAVDRPVVISRLLQDYVTRHAGLDSETVSLPVFGSSPFPALGRHDRGSVTLINPCVEKGPLLLEIGARMHGGENPLLAAQCGARSQVEQTVRAVADPTRFSADAVAGYELTHHCTVAFLMPPSSGRLRARPRVERIEALEAFHKLEIADCLGELVPPVIGWVALIHPDKQAVDASLAALRRLEAEDFYPVDPLDSPC